MEFLQNPNLPETDVVCAAMSGTYLSLVRRLQTLGIKIITVDSNKNMSAPVSDHADMQIHHLGGNKIIIERTQQRIIEAFAVQGFHVIQSFGMAGNQYPGDVLLNAARAGNKLIGKLSALDKNINDYCFKNHLQIINVNQGYAKCSTVIVNDRSIITADQSIANAALKNEMDVLMIQPGYVELKGYDYGFIGGTCGKIGKNLIAFTGNIELHPDFTKIRNFCSLRNVNVLSLTNTPLQDIGGIIPLIQK